MIRSSVGDLVALCQYVAETDCSPSETHESYRKVRWKQRRENERLARHDFDAAAIDKDDCHDQASHQHASAPLGQPQAVASGETQSDSDDERTENPVLGFNQFMNEFVASDIEVLDVRQLPAVASDPLGAVSVPSRREGHSLTLCSVDTRDVLLVFGGRQLRDLTNLLPVASKEVDPLKLERVRYVFSNGVYSYDLQTTEWTLHQCTGRYPKERSDHSAVFVEPHFLVVFGGRGRSGLILNDLFVLSLREWHWTEIEARTRPSARYWHGACLAGREQLFMFGGKSEVQVYGDIQQFDISRTVELLLRKQQQTVDIPDQGSATSLPDTLMVPLSWTVPHTVGKPPSARFGMRMVRIDHDRIAFVGGWRAKQASAPPRAGRAPRGMDVYVLDTMTMVWTKPRFSSHICRLSAPPERMLFECFATQYSLVVFGGFTYATNGETESYASREDDRHVVYKLDLHRMIWRRHVLDDSAQAALVTTAYPHFSANAVSVRSSDRVRLAYTCVASLETLPLGLTALELRRPRRRLEHPATNGVA